MTQSRIILSVTLINRIQLLGSGHGCADRRARRGGRARDGRRDPRRRRAVGPALDAVPGAAFHAVTDGLAWLRIAGRADTRLMPGDVVLLPTGIAHVLASAP